MSKFNELVERVINWSEGIDLYGQSTEAKQVSKAFEEFAELIAAIDDKNEYEIKDAIGDILVCLVNAKHLEGGLEIYKNCFDSTRRCFLEILSDVAADMAYGDYNSSLGGLEQLCIELNFDIEECFEMAVDTIEKRKLLMVNGKAVKWENMTEEQRDIWRSRNEI